MWFLSDGMSDLNYENSSKAIVSFEVLNPNIAHNSEILRQYAWNDNDVRDIGHRLLIYTDDRKREQQLLII